jgi:thiamine biosynthesis protein ThiS
MKIKLNGQWKEHEALTLTELICSYDLQKEHVITEVDGDIIDRDQWDTFQLKENMHIEMVRFVGGG